MFKKFIKLILSNEVFYYENAGNSFSRKIFETFLIIWFFGYLVIWNFTIRMCPIKEKSNVPDKYSLFWKTAVIYEFAM